jgi:hypothetical protein
MRSSHPRSPIDHPSNGSKSQIFGQPRSLFLFFFGVTVVFRCQWVKHPNDVNVDNYGLTMVDLENVGHQDDPWVIADRVAHVFYVLNPETGKHVVVSGKQKIVGVQNVKDNDEFINQFEEMSLFTNPMNIKRIEKDFDSNVLLYMQKGGK